MKYQKVFLFYLPVLVYIISSFFRSEGSLSNYQGLDTSSLDKFGLALETLSVVIPALYVTLASSIKLRLDSKSHGNIINAFFIFYILLLPSFFVSASWITSVNYAIRVICYLLWSVGLYEYARKNSYFRASHASYSNTYIYLTIFLAPPIASFVSYYRATSFEALITFGAQGSYSGLLLMVSSLFIYINQLRNRKNLISAFSLTCVASLFILLSFALNSLTSLVIGIVISFIVIRLTSGLLCFFALLGIGAYALHFLYNLLGEGSITVANKNLDVILSGTGRGEIFQQCWQTLFDTGDFIHNFLGGGFMSESVLLVDSGFHTCHNSFLSAALGGGFFGLLGVLLFYLLVSSYVFKVLIGSRWSGSRSTLIEGGGVDRIFFACCILGFMLFGIASPVFPGTPTFLMPIASLFESLGKVWTTAESETDVTTGT